MAEAAERMRRSRIALNERALWGWGVVNIAIITVQMFIAPVSGAVGIPIGNLNKYFMLSLAAWIGAALLRKTAPLRLPGAMICLILVQVWFTVASFASQVQLGRSVEFSAPDYSLVTFFLCFIQGSMLVYFAPQVRVLLKRMIVCLALVSAFLAVLQFVGFGPAITYGNLMVSIQDITDWGGKGGIRSSGLFSGLVLQTSYSLIAIGLIASALYSRKLTVLEIGAIVLLTGTIFMAQVRNLLPVVAAVMIPLIVLFVRKQGRASVPYVAVGVLVLAGLVLQGGERFDYIFSNDTSTFDYRQDVLWPQARTIYENRPWFGIGVEPEFAGFNSMMKSRWSDGLIMDSGYLVALAFGGLPALTFMILTVIAAAYGSIMLLIRRTVTPIERGFAFTAATVTLMFGFGMYFNNLFTNISAGMLYFILVGVALPSKPADEPLLGGDPAEPGVPDELEESDEQVAEPEVKSLPSRFSDPTRRKQ